MGGEGISYQPVKRGRRRDILPASEERAEKREAAHAVVALLSLNLSSSIVWTIPVV